MNRGGLCNACIAPGHCCRAMHLTGSVGPDRIDSALSHEAAEHMALRAGLPFRPLIQREADGQWLWWCPALDDRTGRCTIYDDRPQLCRDYAAGSDALCVHFVARDDDGDLVKAA